MLGALGGGGLVFGQVGGAKSGGFGQFHEEVGGVLEGAGAGGKGEVEHVTTSVAVGANEVQVKAGHVDALGVVREAEANHGAGDVGEFEERLVLGDFGQGWVGFYLARHAAGFDVREVTVDAHGIEVVLRRHEGGELGGQIRKGKGLLGDPTGFGLKELDDGKGGAERVCDRKHLAVTFDLEEFAVDGDHFAVKGVEGAQPEIAVLAQSAVSEATVEHAFHDGIERGHLVELVGAVMVVVRDARLFAVATTMEAEVMEKVEKSFFGCHRRGLWHEGAEDGNFGSGGGSNGGKKYSFPVGQLFVAMGACPWQRTTAGFHFREDVQYSSLSYALQAHGKVGEIVVSERKQVIIYTDGAATGNPGPGGYGTVLLFGEHRRELSGGYRLTTNNRMEIMAAIAGLAALKAPCQVTLYSDSEYLVRAMREGWAVRWRARDWWRTKTEKAANPDLWQRLLELCAGHTVEFVHVRGHAGNEENERCDRLAVAAAAGKDLPADTAYEASRQGGPPERRPEIREGEPCRKCNTPVVKRFPKSLPKPGERYHAYYLYCPGCQTNYTVAEALRRVTRRTFPHSDCLVLVKRRRQ